MEAWFSRGLQDWYSQNKRDLPWRKEKDPYKIWLSEIILQQTQVVQGLNYYLKFVRHYPDVGKLASASEDEILKDWQGLGYYSRARNLHAAAKTIVGDHKGVFPSTFESIRKLKGVGDYTAAAIASFAFGLPHAVVDGNVYRLLSRVFGIDTAIDTGVGKKQFQQLADSLLNRNNPAEYNQAIMEFGSQYCKPVKPDCTNCIFSRKCYAFKSSMIERLPFKEKKIKIRTRFFNYIILRDSNDNLLVRKRGGGDIWQGLYEFPLIETKNKTAMHRILGSKEFKTIAGDSAVLVHESKAYKHVLSHQHLHAKFFVFETIDEVKGEKITRQNVSSLAFPRLIEKFIEDSKLTKKPFF